MTTLKRINGVHLVTIDNAQVVFATFHDALGFIKEVTK